jgi:hypothetical protein
MDSSPWAVTLNQTTEERLEERVASIANYLSKTYSDGQWQVLDLDATGECGGKLTLKLNEVEKLHLLPSDFLEVLTEEGQIIDLEAAILVAQQPLFKIIIQDGNSVDVLGRGNLPPSNVLGAYQTSEPQLFLWN